MWFHWELCVFELGEVSGSICRCPDVSEAHKAACSSWGSQLCRRMFCVDFPVFSLNCIKSCAGREEELFSCWGTHRTLSRSGPGPAAGPGLWQAPAAHGRPPQCWESRLCPLGGKEGGKAGGERVKLSREPSCLP